MDVIKQQILTVMKNSKHNQLSTYHIIHLVGNKSQVRPCSDEEIINTIKELHRDGVLERIMIPGNSSSIYPHADIEAYKIKDE